MTISQYLEQVQKLYKTGLSSEHSYRGDLRTLLESIVSGVMVTNEPKRIACGAPDYIITRNDIPVGYIEAKDLGRDIGHKDYKEQFDRYRKSLNNLIITDYLDFWLYIDGELKTKLRIAEIIENNIQPIPENFDQFNALIRSFCTHVGQTIKSASKLSVMMADKAKLLSQIIENSLNSDVENEENSTLKEQMHGFKDILIHDITPREFADIYAQTIAYGMFAARLHDTSLDTFSRQEAAELIPKTNPFLRKLFQYVAGIDLDSRIIWIVDALADIFRATDVAALLKNFGKATRTHDPIIHFYETFLAEYDPKLRKSRGVWYTPAPVVNFIVRAVDDILKSDFNLSAGLADNSKTKVIRNTQNEDARTTSGYRKVEEEVHKVQILDPATGTGTFLAEVVRQVYSKFSGQQGIWSNYAENHLIPRLNGFELLMASYAMAHLKLDMLLTETGFKSTKNQRFRIYLTNSLEEHHKDTGTIFANWLSGEANEANHIKRDTPVMVIMGNPPYSGESSNKGEWIMSLIEDYKKEPGGKEKLKERNPKWLNDDYVKFIKYGQHFIEKNGEGILAFINPHGFLENPTFRGMRWNLLKTYDKIYTIDLHGNSNKKEVSLDNSVDMNVFDIQQGVSINIFIKTGQKKLSELGKVWRYDLYGKREFKYNFLVENSIHSIPFKEIEYNAPNYFFLQKDLAIQREYDKGFKINELMSTNVLGYQTHRDKFAVDEDLFTLENRLKDLYNSDLNDQQIRNKYAINESQTWHLNIQREKFKKLENYKTFITNSAYRPFDNQFVILHSSICDRPRTEIIDNVINKDNFCLLSSKQQAVEGFRHCFLTKLPANDCVMSTTSKEANQVFPLYIYPKFSNQQSIDSVEKRIPNLKKDIIQKFTDCLSLTFQSEKDDLPETLAPIDILDYMYAILHSPTYREKYKEFLKIDFPRIPYPKSSISFFSLVKLGGKIRALHLLEDNQVNKFITGYPIDGSNVVKLPIFRDGKVYINETQYFENVPLLVWQFYIGGYQPAQKWLKDRKGKELSYEDILHYQRMVVALYETDKLMKEIDEINFE